VTSVVLTTLTTALAVVAIVTLGAAGPSVVAVAGGLLALALGVARLLAILDALLVTNDRDEQPASTARATTGPERAKARSQQRLAVGR
jgi:protein-S-isoprenylcysteine O-methyltransferase Ste14